jgi:hypothetical protein
LPTDFGALDGGHAANLTNGPRRPAALKTRVDFRVLLILPHSAGRSLWQTIEERLWFWAVVVTSGLAALLQTLTHKRSALPTEELVIPWSFDPLQSALQHALVFVLRCWNVFAPPRQNLWVDFTFRSLGAIMGVNPYSFEIQGVAGAK